MKFKNNYDTKMEFIRCRNCNKYAEKNKTFAEYYCTAECAAHYRKCKNCGSFFPESEEDYCSDECRKLTSNNSGE